MTTAEFIKALRERHPKLTEFDEMCAVAAAIGQGVIDLELPKPRPGPPGPPWWDRLLVDGEPWGKLDSN